MESDNSVPLEIDSPINLLPDLTLWGIEEIDRGVCEDTAVNRTIIRSNSGYYQPVYDAQGKDTNLIQVISAEMRAAALTGGNKKYILTDNRNADSDYITGLRLLMDPSSFDTVPAWVIASSRAWREIEKNREKNPNYRSTVIGPPARCSAIKVDGHRCQMWTNGTANYGDFCRAHVAQRAGEDTNRPHSLAQARRRLETASVQAVDKLIDLMEKADSDSVMLGAARDVLDRAGIRQGIDINNTINVGPSAADMIAKRLDKLRENALKVQSLLPVAETETVVYAEVVEDDEK